MAGEIKKDAKITVGVEGAEDVGAAASKAFAPWEAGGKRIAQGIQSAGNAVASFAQTAISDITRVASAAAGISAAQGIASFRALEDQIARLGAASGKSLGNVRGEIAAAAKGAQLGESTVAAWAKGVGRLTYDYGQGARSIAAFNQEALATGRSAEEMAPLAVALHNTLGVAGDTADELGRMRSMADALGTTGGPAALQDRLVAVSGVLDTLGHKTAAQRHNLEAMVAGLGKGLSAEGQTRVTSRILGDIAKDPRGYERMLGLKKGSLLDDQGHVADPMRVLELTQAHLKKRGGGNQAHAQMIAANMLGGDYEAGAALLNADVGAMRRAAALGPSGDAAKAAAAYQGSEAGQIAAAQQDKERNQRAIGAKLSPYLLSVEQAAASNPLLTMAGITAGGGLLSSAVGGGIRGGAGMLASLFSGGGGKGGAGGVGALAAAAGSGGAASVYVTNWPEGGGMGGGGSAAGAAARGAGGAGGSWEVAAMRGLTPGLAIAAPIAAAVGAAVATAVGTGVLLHSIGEDRGKMGKRWRDEHQGTIDAEKDARGGGSWKRLRQFQSDSTSKILDAANASGGDPAEMKRLMGPDLMRAINNDPALQSVASGVVNGGIDLADLPTAMREAVVEGIKGTKLEAVVEVTNSADVDVDVEVKGQKAKAAGGRN